MLQAVGHCGPRSSWPDDYHRRVSRARHVETPWRQMFLCNGSADGPAVIHPFKASRPELRKACLRKHAPRYGNDNMSALSANYLRRCSSVLGLRCRDANTRADCAPLLPGERHTHGSRLLVRVSMRKQDPHRPSTSCIYPRQCCGCSPGPWRRELDQHLERRMGANTGCKFWPGRWM